MRTWSVERAVHRGCGVVRAAVALLLAVFDLVHSRRGDKGGIVWVVGCPTPDHCDEFGCAGFCREASEPSRDSSALAAIKRDLDFFQQGEQGGGPW